MKIRAMFRGNIALNEKIKQIKNRLTTRYPVFVGLPAGSGNDEQGTSLVAIGAMLEFGSTENNIPQYSFLRLPLRQNIGNIQAHFRSLSPKVSRGEITASAMFRQIGQEVAGYCKAAVPSDIVPTNTSPFTVSRIGIGVLKQAITYVLED
ncbi:MULTISPECIES: hypothetical protein [Enterobacteriaceae]|jgi:hypothetical protein|uniref:Uncharacterized protein n=2 Tax=Enterobacteriaceae TaxID=543 RepID=A0ABW1Q377_9ENTR|nr:MULTISPECIES: hypothetical protein [Phytobacter]MBS6739351.1 hypothetical protein [Enterobacteriaceae bacterium]MDU4152728.1 hypothetical protein [Enterobacteriaceae bacterium]MDU7198037.1 hypothetical protein [Enterobacteriaceae bacterium]MDU7377493.1 hypothetical protein [Enterobacteriaceae bacterium]MDV2874059.1 hypothetical protein [Phytobacter diazotrophicus]